MPFPAEMDFRNMVRFEMGNVEVIKLGTAKGAVGWHLGGLPFRVIEED